MISTFVDSALEELSERFDALCSHCFRPSNPPKWLLRARLLQVLYCIRSERLLMEQLED
jgi:transposase